MNDAAVRTKKTSQRASPAPARTPFQLLVITARQRKQRVVTLPRSSATPRRRNSRFEAPAEDAATAMTTTSMSTPKTTENPGAARAATAPIASAATAAMDQ